MSTSNFHNVNASKIFAVEVEEDYDYDDLILNLESELVPVGGVTDPNELRSYPSRIVGTLRSGNTEIFAVVRSGYYSGVNLDWFMEHDGYSSCADFEDMVNCDDTINDERKRLLKELAHTEAEYLRNRLETIFIQYSTPLKVVARFSNGETIYGKDGK